MKRILVILKWKYLRWRVKRHRIGFGKCMLRMYWIQELKTLPQYNLDELAGFSYFKLRKLFIKEFPHEVLHNPYDD